MEQYDDDFYVHTCHTWLYLFLSHQCQVNTPKNPIEYYRPSEYPIKSSLFFVLRSQKVAIFQNYTIHPESSGAETRLVLPKDAMCGDPETDLVPAHKRCSANTHPQEESCLC